MQYLRGLLFLTLSVLACVVAAAELQIVTLKYRSAEQVIPIIRPLIAQGGAVTGAQNQLFVRTTKANLAEIKKVLERLDVPPRRLVIYVSQSAEGPDSRIGAEVGARSGDAAIDNTQTGQTRDGMKARVYETRGASNDRTTQQIQVLEGSRATIQVGRSVPVPSQTATLGIYGLAYSDAVTYRDFATGFEVVPRISGEFVFLDISPHRETSIGSRGGADLQSAVTTVSSRLGEWFELGASNRNEARDDSSVLLGAAGQRKDNRSIWVKVEEIK